MFDNWRFLEMTGSIREIFATEEALLDSIDEGPILMIYRSKPHSISIAKTQDLSELDLDKCKILGADWSRRISGGRAVYHNFITDFSYAIIAPAKPYIKESNVPNITEAYADICQVVINALKYLGIPANLDNHNFVVVDGKKISGSAQHWKTDPKTKTHKSFIQHGYVLYELPSFRTGYQMIKARKSQEERTREAIAKSTAITEYVRTSFSDVVNAFLETTHCTKMFLRNYERKRIEDLLNNKYNTDWWQLGKNLTTKTKGDCIRGVPGERLGAVIE